MNIKNLRFAMAGLAVFSLISNASAWHSVLGSTHEKISKKAYKTLNTGVYPDLKKASEEIQDGSSSERGHEGNGQGGGKMKDWWDGADGRKTLLGGVLPNYTKFLFSEAYYNIGRMVHLTQDQAVPAHAARVPHGWGGKHIDDMEYFAQYRADFDAVPLVDNAKQPYEYYQELQNNTRNLLPTWINPETRQPYWNLAAAAPEYGKDVTLGATGSYGAKHDGYAKSVTVEGDSNNYGSATNNTEVVSSNPEIARDRLAIAAGYTQAMIESASKNLPPLVSTLTISGNVLSPGQKMGISFTALENRGNKAGYSVTVARAGGTPETVLEGVIELKAPANGEYLASRTVTLNWDGLIAGRQPAEGTYTLEVNLTDMDGNTVPARVNSDEIRQNDTKAVFSVVNVGAGKSLSLSF
jgi:hypothetical protein